MQIEPLTITYTGYEICDSYPEQGEEDLYFSVEAGTGKKLLVLQVAVTNPGQEQVEFDTLHKQNIKYRVMLNGADRHQVMLTMLDNDFSAMDIMINPGKQCRQSFWQRYRKRDGGADYKRRSRHPVRQ